MKINEYDQYDENEDEFSVIIRKGTVKKNKVFCWTKTALVHDFVVCGFFL